MRRALLLIFLGGVWTGELLGQSAVNVRRPEEKDKVKRAVAKQQEKRAQAIIQQLAVLIDIVG